MTDYTVRRVNCEALRQAIASDINNIGIYNQESIQILLSDVLGISDGVLSGLLATTDNTNIYISAGGKMIQDGLVGTSESTTIAVTKPGAGTRTDILVGQIVEEDENLTPRLFLENPDTEVEVTQDSYIESVQRIAFDYLTDTEVVPAGWILLATVDVTSTTITITDDRDFSNAVEAQDLLSDIQAYIDSLGYVKGVDILKNGSSSGTVIKTIDFIEGDNVTLTMDETPEGEQNVTISVPDIGGTIETVTGTSGTVNDPSTIQFAAGTNITSIVASEPVAGTAFVTINAAGGGSGGAIVGGYVMEEQTGSQGVFTGSAYRYTLTTMTAPDANYLSVYVGGRKLELAEWTRINDTTIDLVANVQPENTNIVTFEYFGDGNVIAGIDVSGSAGTGATLVDTFEFVPGDNVADITVTEGTPDTATIEIDCVNDSIGTVTGNAGSATNVNRLNFIGSGSTVSVVQDAQNANITITNTGGNVKYETGTLPYNYLNGVDINFTSGFNNKPSVRFFGTISGYTTELFPFYGSVGNGNVMENFSNTNIKCSLAYHNLEPYTIQGIPAIIVNMVDFKPITMELTSITYIAIGE